MNFKDTVFFIVACFFILFLWESPVLSWRRKATTACYGTMSPATDPSCIKHNSHVHQLPGKNLVYAPNEFILYLYVPSCLTLNTNFTPGRWRQRRCRHGRSS